MSTHNATLVDRVASEIISKGQGVKYLSGGWDACDTAGELAEGIAFSDAANGEAFAVQVGGIVKYKAGTNAILDGASLTMDANGLADTATTGDYVRLKAKGACAAGAYGEAYWFDGYVFDGT